MKKIITILTFSLLTVTAGLAFAYDAWNVGAEDELYGITSTAPVTQVSGAAAGGIREAAVIKDENKGTRIFDSMLGAHQEVLFDSYTIQPVAADRAQGKAAGGVRGDRDRIFDSMFGARQAVLFE